MNYRVSAYRTAQVSTASPGQIVVSLYDGALRFVQEAARAYGAGDSPVGRAAVVKAERIVLELMANLDPERGGDLATALLRLYQYMIERLSAARESAGGPGLSEVEEMLEVLRDAWAEADRQLRQERRGDG